MIKQDIRVIVALDFDAIDELRAFVAKLSPRLCRLKIGNILFTRYGAALVQELMDQGFDVFLDLKFHDIPQTVARSCQAAAELGVWMINLHIASGFAAMKAARTLVDQCSHKPLLIGVTVLTSLQQEDLLRIGITQPLPDLVLSMAEQAREQGLDGIVCSSQEAKMIRQHLGDAFILVTPGIRLQQSVDDQQRVCTPIEAFNAGASYLVIGRPITQADDPVAVLESIVEEK